MQRCETCHCTYVLTSLRLMPGSHVHRISCRKTYVASHACRCFEQPVKVLWEVGCSFRISGSAISEAQESWISSHGGQYLKRCAHVIKLKHSPAWTNGAKRGLLGKIPGLMGRSLDSGATAKLDQHCTQTWTNRAKLVRSLCVCPRTFTLLWLGYGCNGNRMRSNTNNNMNWTRMRSWMIIIMVGARMHKLP